MKIWNQAPLVRLLLPFIIGILLALKFPFPGHYFLWILSSFYILIAGKSLLPDLGYSFSRALWFGGVLNLFLVLLGYQLTLFKTEIGSTHHFSHLKRAKVMAYARITEPIIEKEKSLKSVVEIIAVQAGVEWLPVKGKVLMYLQEDSNSKKLDYGDELVFSASINAVKSPLNPHCFDYKRFLSFRGIFHQAYLKSGDWVATGGNSANWLKAQALSIRKSLLNILQSNGLEGEEYSVGAALLLGYTDKLDADLMSAYSNTGALHVLSVSGLHVAIVYIVYSWLLFFLNKSKFGRIIKAVILLLFLWFYAGLTGFSPSVLRAATMLSFIIVAKATNQHTNVYNTLAASAFLLLLIDPFLIMDVGFQLSYLAVIGIVYLQPQIYDLIEFDNWLLNQSWNVTAVSLAAQVATFPLGLYYFHQFPVYFLVSNLVVIPVSTLIIYLGIVLFTFSKIPLVSKYVALVFGWLIWFLNASVKWMESLPYSAIEGISISGVETVLLYAMIIVLLFYLSELKFNFLKLFFILGIALLTNQIIEQLMQSHQKKLIVYSVPKVRAIDFICGKKNVVYADSAFAEDKKAQAFQTNPNWCYLGLQNPICISEDFKNDFIYVRGNFVRFLNTRVYLLDKELEPGVKMDAIDYLIVSKNVKMSIAEIQACFNARLLVFDGSNSEFKLRKWKEECKKLRQAYYCTSDSGALEVDL